MDASWCPVWIPGCGAVQVITQGANIVVETVKFSQDPAGYINSMMQQAVATVFGDVIPLILGAATPDYSMAGFLRAYSGSFGISISIMAVLFLINLAGARKGGQAGRDALNAVVLWIPIFMWTTSLGPLLGMLLSGVSTAVSTGVLQWMTVQTSSQFFQAIAQRFASGDFLKLTGGPIPVGLCLIAMIVAGIVDTVLIAIQSTAQYLLAGLAGLGFVWMTSPKTRKFAVGFAVVIGVSFAILPLLVIVTAVSILIMNGLNLDWSTAGEVNGVQALFNVIRTVIIFVLVSFFPMALIALARQAVPIAGVGQKSVQSTTSDAPSRALDQGGNTMESLGRRAYNSSSSSPGSSAPSPSSPPSSSFPSPSSPSPGGSGLPVSSPGAGAVSGSAASSAAGTTASTAAPVATGTVAAGTAAAGGAVAGGGAAAGGAVAAGTAVSATGVGAIVGVPLIIAAAAMKVASKGTSMASSMAGVATGSVDHGEGVKHR
ncbi:hypothetical protein [Rathayibacter rathayi]|uniref:hypothetical protein n=1 Tax=Rathayibacter rathayi TaxID=33887 RepID=UPI000BC63F48|nr:hypothetical protein [Rathayibacter rathayi]MWV76010.1 hypothetical protein [Rathayibacter rathayi NCPPB 2980 = VKM Ac-1601]SOE06001.1 hypothetical protein SAMN06295924_1228 [Rathayibacter rathayi NCPPB 2980 = VKM Ac-1601]